MDRPDGAVNEPREPAEPTEPVSELEEKPPILGSWRALYLVVLGNLVFLVMLFTWITVRYR